jgi:hypothetical protein
LVEVRKEREWKSGRRGKLEGKILRAARELKGCDGSLLAYNEKSADRRGNRKVKTFSGSCDRKYGP